MNEELSKGLITPHWFITEKPAVTKLLMDNVHPETVLFTPLSPSYSDGGAARPQPPLRL